MKTKEMKKKWKLSPPLQLGAFYIPLQYWCNWKPHILNSQFQNKEFQLCQLSSVHTFPMWELRQGSGGGRADYAASHRSSLATGVQGRPKLKRSFVSWWEQTEDLGQYRPTLIASRKTYFSINVPTVDWWGRAGIYSWKYRGIVSVWNAKKDI